MSIVAACCLLAIFACSAQAAQPNIGLGCNHAVSAKVGVAHAAQVWDPSRWRRLDGPKDAAVRRHRRNVRCAKGPRHRAAIQDRWRVKRAQFKVAQRKQLARHSINHVWGPPMWAPDWRTPPGSQLPPYVIAALAERTGDFLGIDVPGWTMAQMTEGESIRRPASAAVDPGGRSVGYGLHAITRPFNDDLLSEWGWGYEPDMWNPMRNTVIMALIYGRQGLGAWYGNRHVTCWSCHYRGRFDLRLVLGGKSFKRALG